jgi:predicted homoserine dehydrogenase-like protein
MITSFADGTKISCEHAIVTNATSFKVRSRGMSRGLEYRDDIMQIGNIYDIEELRHLGGIVDYVVGTPLTKVYVLAEHPDPKQQHYLNLYKNGRRPALFVLHSIPSRPFRSAKFDRPGSAIS